MPPRPAPGRRPAAQLRPGQDRSPAGRPANNKQGKRHYGTHVFLIVMAAMWLVPLGWAIFTALRPKADTDKYGYFSTGGAFNFDNFVQAWTQGGFASCSGTPCSSRSRRCS